MPVLVRIAEALVFSALIAVAQPPTPASEWLPDGAIFAVRIDRPAAFLKLATEFKVWPPADKGLQLLVEGLAKRAGTDSTGLIRNLTADGVTYAMYPADHSVWVLDSKDATVLDPLQQFAKAMIGTAAGFYREYPVAGEKRAAAWSFDGKQFFARTGNRLLLANRGEMIKTLFAPRVKGSLETSQLYLESRRAVGDPDGWVFIDMTALKQAPPIRKGLAAIGDPLDMLLNGGWKESLSTARWVATGLTVAGHTVRMHLATDGTLSASGAGLFTQPASGGGVLPNLRVPGELVAASLWRDLGKFYAGREAFFPQRTSGGILAENFMEIFFTGRDLADDVFSKFHPQVRLVVARQDYAAAVGTPEEQFPAAALVFRTDPNCAADFGEVMEEAWQKAVGLTNFTRGQSALPGVILDRQTYGGVTFTYAAFSVRGEKDRGHLPSQFNMRPAIVRDGQYLILSTTDALARDLIDAVNKEDGRSLEASHSHTVVEVTSAAGIAALLRVNQAAMVRQSVLTSGKKPEQAAKDFEGNVAWLDKIVRAKLSLSANQADLEVELK